MTLIAIVGELGSGKTLTQTFVLFRNHLKGKRVYANYRLNFPYSQINDIEDIDRMRAGIFGGDELWAWLDSRASKDERNRVIAGILLKSRKRDIDIVYTCQHFIQMDKRVRNVTDYVVMPQMNKQETFCRAFWYNRTELQFAHPKPISVTKFTTGPIFKLYDTRQEIEELPPWKGKSRTG